MKLERWDAVVVPEKEVRSWITRALEAIDKGKGARYATGGVVYTISSGDTMLVVERDTDGHTRVYVCRIVKAGYQSPPAGGTAG